MREEDVDNGALSHSGRVGDGVPGPVGGEQEAIDARHKSVLLGRGPELEEVKDRKGKNEGRDAPGWAVGEEEEGERGDGAHGSGEAQAEGAHSDASKGFGLAREELP